MAILLLAGAVLYFLPSLIAAWRGHAELRLIFVQNLLLGWSPIDWVVALTKACSANPGRSRPPLL